MPELSLADEKRLDSVQWLHGSFLRGVQLDIERRDVAVFAVTEEHLIELLCEDVTYAQTPNLFDAQEVPRLLGLVIQPLPDTFVVRVEFSNHPAELHLHCRNIVVRKDPLRGP